MHRCIFIILDIGTVLKVGRDVPEYFHRYKDFEKMMQ